MPGTAEDATLRRWLRSREPLAISAIAWTEFLCGPSGGTVAESTASLFTDLVPFGSDEASLTADLFNRSGRRRGTLVDCMVAATAIAADASLATANAADLRRLQRLGLRLEVD